MRPVYSLIVLKMLLFTMAACGAAPTSEAQTSPVLLPAQPAPSATIISDENMTAIPEPLQESYTEYTSGNLWLRLTAPQDGDTVNQQVIKVTGYAPAETVISINEEIFLVTADESFFIPITLNEGPNVIELIASDIDDEKIELILTIVYEK